MSLAEILEEENKKLKSHIHHLAEVRSKLNTRSAIWPIALKNCHIDKHVLLTQNLGFYVKIVTVTTFRFALFANPYATLLYKSETSLKHFWTMAS